MPLYPAGSIEVALIVAYKQVLRKSKILFRNEIASVNLFCKSIELISQHILVSLKSKQSEQIAIPPFLQVSL